MPAPLVLERSLLRVTVGLDPLAIEIRRGRRLIRELRLWAAGGEPRDQFIQLTEGMVAAEELERPARFGAARRNGDGLTGELGDVRVELEDERVVIHFEPAGDAFRIGAEWEARSGRALHRARRAPRRAGRADRPARPPRRRPPLHGPGLPAGHARRGRHPAGRLRAGALARREPRLRALARDRRRRRANSTSATASACPPVRRPDRFACTCSRDPTPAARLRRFLRVTGLPPVLPDWAYGHWKSRDVYEHQLDVEDDFEGYRRHGLPLDALVLDSPWETQYNTWEPNPHQFPDFEGMIAPLPRGRRANCRLGHAVGQHRVARRPAATRP